MDFKLYTFSNAGSSDSHADLSENEVRICSSQFEKITGTPATRYRLKPWEAPVVRVSSTSGAVYRLLRGHGSLSILGSGCWIGPKTRSQLDVYERGAINVTLVHPQWLGRLRYLDEHPENEVRLIFKTAKLALILGVVNFALRPRKRES
jgi:hypothetical protein